MGALHAHVACGAGEHGEAVLPIAVAQPIDRGPVGGACAPHPCAAIDAAIGQRLRAIPELHIAAGQRHHHVDLLGQCGLQRQLSRIDAAGKRADAQAVIGQRAGVVDQAIHTGAEATDVGDVEGAIQGEIAVDRQHAGLAGHSQERIERGVGGKAHAAGGQQCPTGHYQTAAVVHRDRRTDHTAAAQGATGAHGQAACTGQRAIDIQGARSHLRGAAQRAGAGELQRAGAHLVQIARIAQAAGKGAADVIEAELQRVAAQDRHIAQPGHCAQRRIAAEREPGACRDIHCAGGPQCTGCCGGQYAGLHRHRAGEGVAAGQAQGAESGLGQGARAAERAGQCQVIRTGDGQIGAKVDVVAQCQRNRVAQGGIAQHRQAANTQRGVAAHRQGACVQHAATGIAVGAAERERGRTVLDQAAGAVDCTGQAQIVAAGQTQRTIEHHRIGHRQCLIGVQRGAGCCGQRAGAQCLRIAQDQAAAAQCSAAGVGVGCTQHQGAGVEFLHAADARDGDIDGGGCTRVHANCGQRVGHVQRPRAGIGQLIAVADELQATDALRALHTHRAGGTGKHRKIALPGAVGAAVLAGPVGGSAPRSCPAIDGAVGGGLHAIPELHDTARRSDYQIELLADCGLQGELADINAAGKQADAQAVIGQRAGVVDQAIHAGAEATEGGDVEGAIQGEIAVDRQQTRVARRCQRHIDRSALRQRQTSHAE